MSGQTFGGATVDSTGLPSGWWRISLTGTLPMNGATASVAVLHAGADTFAGDGSSAILVWGPNLTQGVDDRPFTLTQGAIAGPIIFNPPAALTHNSKETWVACAGGPNWGGADIYVSLDGGADYQLIGTLTDGPARFGALTASYASGADPDTTDTLSVDLSASGGELTGAADAVADGQGTQCLVDGELIDFSTATATAPNRYNLTTYVRRGQLGTAIAAHAAQAPFVRLDDAIFDFPFLAPNIGATVFAKFASFNLHGNAQTLLQNCIAYPFTPASIGAAGPGSPAWTAVGGQLSNAGQSIPALIITGASDNPSAQFVVFLYRPTGSGAWASDGAHPNTITQDDITSVQAGQSYDVGVQYIVNGSPGQITVIATGIVAGQVSSGGSSGGGGSNPGTVILDTFAAGTWSFTCPAGSYAHVDVEIWGADGGDWWRSLGAGDNEPVHFGGSGAYAIVAGIAATPGTTAFGGSIGTAGSQAGAGHGGGTIAGNGTGTTVSTGATANVGGGGGASNLANGSAGPTGSGGAQTAGTIGGGTESNGRVRITART